MVYNLLYQTHEVLCYTISIHAHIVWVEGEIMIVGSAETELQRLFLVWVLSLGSAVNFEQKALALRYAFRLNIFLKKCLMASSPFIQPDLFAIA